MKAMKIAKRTFTYMDTDGPGEVVAGERVVADHALVRDFPDEFRDFTLDDELQIRSAWVAQMRSEEAERHTKTREPVSRAGRAEREELRFWDSVTRDLERTAPDRPTSAERSEQALFNESLALIESMDSRELAQVNADAERDYGFDRGWSRRVAD